MKTKNNKDNENKYATSTWPSDLKRTANRVAIFEILSKAERPLDANELLQRMQEGGTKVWLSTVYRNLEALENAKLVESYQLPGTETLCYIVRGSGHLHYAICTNCQKLLPLPHCPIEKMENYLEEEGFSLSGHKIELYGLCADCRKEK